VGYPCFLDKPRILPTNDEEYLGLTEIRGIFQRDCQYHHPKWVRPPMWIGFRRKHGAWGRGQLCRWPLRDAACKTVNEGSTGVQCFSCETIIQFSIENSKIYVSRCFRRQSSNSHLLNFCRWPIIAEWPNARSFEATEELAHLMHRWREILWTWSIYRWFTCSKMLTLHTYHILSLSIIYSYHVIIIEL